MSSSTGEPPNKGIDGTVGGLVWVRRRNGSWWPGRIMGLDELPESCLVSPRLGTPVKLLGRKDASIDWYNLEKSKRVKAFRCGEYDECIEKAKASAAILSKKTVKYARREDAIMHALELESSRMGNDHPDLYPRNHSAGKDGTSIMESPTVSESGQGTDEISGDESDFDNDSLSAVELSHSGISFEEPNRSIASKLQAAQGRRRTPNDSEDDGTEGTKRMRGLEDLGMGTASNKKIQVGTVVDHGQPDTTPGSSTVNCVANGNLVNGYKGYPSSLKRRRSQVAAVHDFLKKKNRRRPLTKVLESTAMVSVPVICNPIASSSGNCLGTASETSGLEPIDSKRSTSMVTTNNSGSAGISQDDELTGNASEHARRTEDAQRKMKLKGTSCLAALPENELPHVLFDVPFIGEGKHSRGKVSQAIEKGTSKWQSKGKRNSRHLSENQKRQSAKYTEMDDDPGTHSGGLDNSDVFSQGSDQRVDGNCIDGSPTSYAKMKSGAVRQVDGAIECGSRVVLGESHMKRQAEVKLLPDGSPSTQKSLPYRQSRLTVHSRYKTADYPTGDYLSNSPLYDVELEVQASYRPPHVPLVSLMSKLNGKAIVGHPLTVEVVNDGYCDNNLMNRVNHDLRNATAWGRPDIRPAVQRSGGFAKRTNKSSSRKKSSKMKKSGSLSKKMRKLSSLTGQKRNEEAGQFSVEKPMGPVIACIPLKVVFSRINEAVNGSVRLTHRALASNN